MKARTVSVILVALLVMLQLQLWRGRGSLPQVQHLRDQIEQQQANNARAKFVNERLISEIRDLQQGLDTVESKARAELGMVKPNEIFVQVSK
ncbi:MAG: septum formation initiator family protein [Burkholderiales bacterium]